MKTLPLNKGPATEDRFHINDDSFVIETVQDVQPILDLNHARQNQEVNRKAESRHVASIPHVVMREWMKEFQRTRGVPYHHADPEERTAFLYRKLNDRDNSRLRTWQGKL